MSETALEIFCCGPFRAVDTQGNDVTPKGTKGQAILAMLACAQDNIRSRRWIEQTLWSGKSAPQAGGSLRQALTEIRKSLKPCDDILKADRKSVWLESARLKIDLLDDDYDPARFLDGLDVRDPAFRKWVKRKRGLGDEDTGLRVGKGVRFQCISDGRNGGVIGSIVADQIGQSLEERVSSWLVDGAGDILVKCDLTEIGDRSILTVRVLHEGSGTVLYSGFREFMGEPLQALIPGFLAQLIHETVGRVVWKLPQVLGLDRPEVVATGFANIAMKRLASFDPEKLAEADALFAKSFDADGNGLYLAWQAFVRMAQVVDQDHTVGKTFLDEVNSFLMRALEQAPDNSVALALVSLTRNMLFDDHDVAAELANLATRVNVNGLLARQSLAVAAAGTDSISAYKASLRCQSALGTDGMRHLWDLYHALVCINAGKYREATVAAERAAHSCDSFVAPRRQLVGLYLTQGRTQEAEQLIDELKLLEPSFSLDRYVNDEAYPVLTLRNAGLLKEMADIIGQ